ncbi:HAUS augmin-like complex subunit 1 [Panulirus ornatus]|uniref:HAUS augmin-like complex subunit 1 n=1 Tax=Panulirus ornatus TaxID=150431 RepID=UPI003A865568
MDIKHREVLQWLQEVYGEEQIPPYEKTERSIGILHQLMTASKCSEGNAKVLAEDYAKKAAEYSGEGRQLGKWLEPVKIKTSILSQESQKGLMALASTAQVLDVQIPTSTNIILAMNQLEMDHMQVVNEREQERGRTFRLLEMRKELSRKLDEIRGILQQAEATWSQQQEEYARDIKQEEFIREKKKNYSNDIIQYEAKLSQVGVTENIKHGTLVKQWSELQELEKQMKNLELQLKNYTLPPDITLAEVKVQEARQELAAIMDSFTNAYE